MKTFFTCAICAMIGLSAVAWWIRPKAVQDGKTGLVWVTDNNPARQEQIAAFNRANPEYELRLDPANADMAKVIVQSLGGVGPDLFECGMRTLPSFVKADMVLDITDELKGMGIDVERDVWAACVPNMTYEGRVYAVSRNIASDALWFNKRIFDEEGIPYPAADMTWEEFLPLAKRLTKRGADGKVTRFGFIVSWWQWPHFMIQFGGRIYSEDGTRCELDCPETIRAMQFMQDLIYKHEVMPSPEQETAMATTGGWGSGTITWFGGARVATALGGRWWLCTLRDKENYPKLELGVVPCPNGPTRLYRGYGGAVAINKRSKQCEGALKFIEYMSRATYNELINDQADALAPFKRFSYEDRFLHNPEFPEEDNNEVWRVVMERSVSERLSPFIEASVADRLIQLQLDLIKSKDKTAAEAMKTAAKEVNEAIAKNLRKNPRLREKYEALTGRSEPEL